MNVGGMNMPEPIPDAISEGTYFYNEILYEHAIQEFEKTLHDVETEDNWRVKAIIYCNIGECYFQVKQFSNALENYEGAHSLIKEIKRE